MRFESAQELQYRIIMSDDKEKQNAVLELLATFFEIIGEIVGAIS